MPLEIVDFFTPDFTSFLGAYFFFSTFFGLVLDVFFFSGFFTGAFFAGFAYLPFLVIEGFVLAGGFFALLVLAYVAFAFAIDG